MPHRIALSLALGLACPAIAGAATPFNAPADIQAITAIETSNASDLQLDRVMANYAPDATVYDLMTTGIYNGHGQIRAGFAPQLAAVKSITATMPQLTILSDGSMACAATQIHFNAVAKSGSTISTSVRQLDVLRKINGRWLIEEEDVSFPTDPKSGKSLTDYAITPPGPTAWGDNPFPGPPVADATAKAGIRAWLEAFATAPNIEAALALTGPGDASLFFDLFATAPLQGAKAIAAVDGPGFTPIASVTADFTDFRADTDGLLGAQIDRQNLTIKMKSGGTVKWQLRESDCLHYVNGKWYTLIDELSFPIDLKTGKAAMLPP
jgi:ketosteroid isomerase-like protein